MMDRLITLLFIFINVSASYSRDVSMGFVTARIPGVPNVGDISAALRNQFILTRTMFPLAKQHHRHLKPSALTILSTALNRYHNFDIQQVIFYGHHID